jgi:hypothetical protein
MARCARVCAVIIHRRNRQLTRSAARARRRDLADDRRPHASATWMRAQRVISERKLAVIEQFLVDVRLPGQGLHGDNAPPLGGLFVRAPASLGARSFGMQVPPNGARLRVTCIFSHDHADIGM